MFLLGWALWACSPKTSDSADPSGDTADPIDTADTSTDTGTSDTAEDPCAGPGDFCLGSSAFVNEGFIPEAYSCDAAQPSSPPLTWLNAPQGTAALAITVRDPDADDCVHWGLLDLPAETVDLEEGAGTGGPLPAGAWQTLAYTGVAEYAGPCPPPPHEAHHYEFRVYALSGPLGDPGEEVELDAIEGSLQSLTLGTATLIGLYDR